MKIAAIVGVIVLALAGLAFGMKTMSAAEDYTPSPGGQGAGATTAPKGPPPMPGGPPPGVAPGTMMDKKR